MALRMGGHGQVEWVGTWRGCAQRRDEIKEAVQVEHIDNVPTAMRLVWVKTSAGREF